MAQKLGINKRNMNPLELELVNQFVLQKQHLSNDSKIDDIIQKNNNVIIITKG